MLTLRHRTAATCLAFVMTVPFQGAAQTPTPEPPPTELAQFDELVEVSEVLLDVLVTDADGNAVLGLGPDDFVIEEDGEAVQITEVSYYTSQYGDGVDGPMEEVPWSRYLILVFDQQNRFAQSGTRNMRQMIKVGSQTQRWIEEEMAPSDWVAVVRWDGALQVYQDFTQDREALVRAVKRTSAGKSPEPQRTRDTGLASILRQLPRRQQGERMTIYDALGSLAEASGFIVGRKNLILFTLGFGRENRFGHDTDHDTELYTPLETLLNDHNVAVYPIDTTPAGRQPRYSGALGQLAEDTGGVYHENFIGFINPLKDVAEENVGYYLVSYQSARPAGEVGYQRLDVRTADPDMEVRTRRGYRYGL